MAVRQQQRRGTASQWVSANPILAAGEIGFEVDTNKFKIGDGTNRWEDLVYFTADAASAIADLIDGAPGLLDTLNELAAAIGDDADFFTTVTSNIATAKSEAISAASTDATSKVAAEATARNTAIATAKSEAISTAASDATTKANNAKSGAETTAANALASHESDTTNIHGIADTSALATKTYADNAASSAVAAVVNSAPEALNTLKELADALTADESTAASLATLVGTKAPSANPTFTGTVAGITKSMVGLGNVDNTSDANKPVSSATQTALDAKASNSALASHEADTTNIHGIADTSALATKTYADSAVSTAVSALTKSSVGLANVDNTSDANKPVSTAAQTALDLKAPLASPALTGTPTAPTASYSTDTTQLATTAFVKSVLNNIGTLNLVLDGGGVSQ